MNLHQVLLSGLQESPRPAFAGAAAILQVDGRIVQSAYVGEQARYMDGAGTFAPSHERRPVTDQTIFDIASLTKLFVAVTLMSLVQDRALELDRPVRHYLPEFAGGARDQITLRHLLTHTSGLPEDLPLWRLPQPLRLTNLASAPLSFVPGTGHQYSCVGYIIAGLVASAVTGMPLNELVQARIFGPLKLLSTTYIPPQVLQERIAWTEDESAVGRGMVHGVVHDEMAWALGGVAGNAGIFSTASDIASFGEAVRNGGQPLVSAEMLTEMTRDQDTGKAAVSYRQGLGFRMDDATFMSGLGPGALGHTGFTGTSLVIDPYRSVVLVLLTNRVHPVREGGDVAAVRTALAKIAASTDPRPAK